MGTVTRTSKAVLWLPGWGGLWNCCQPSPAPASPLGSIEKHKASLIPTRQAYTGPLPLGPTHRALCSLTGRAPSL